MRPSLAGRILLVGGLPLASGFARTPARAAAGPAEAAARSAGGALRIADGLGRAAGAATGRIAAAGAGPARQTLGAAAGAAGNVFGAAAGAASHALGTAAGAAAEACGTAAQAVGRTAGAAGQIVEMAVRTVPAADRADRAASAAASAAAAVVDVGRSRTRRRVWVRGGRAHVEVRGLTGRGPAHRRLAADVTAALRRLRGVRWAEVNAVTAQVLVDFDEGSVGIDELVGAVEAVERTRGTQDEPFSWSAAPHPADDAPVFSTAAALCADLTGMAAAASSRAIPFLRLPATVRVPIVIAETQPRIRTAVLRRFGPTGGELILTLASAAAHGASRGMAPLGVDAACRLLQLGELRARRLVWARRELDLHASGRPLPAERPERRPRPAPVPPGPPEAISTWTSMAGLGGAGAALAWTGDAGQAADLILATRATAGRLGREGFATMLGVELARAGVVPLDGSALRLLDRVTAVVIDSAALCTPRARILSATDGGGLPAPPDAWQAAERLLAARPFTDLERPGPWDGDGWRLARHDRWRLARHDGRPSGAAAPAGLAADLLDDRGRRRASFLVGSELDARAETLLGAARECADRVVLTQHASTRELVAWADEVIPADGELAEEIRRLQSAGHVVLAVSDSQTRALEAADVGVGLLTDVHGVCWSADLLCGPGLGQAWRVLRACRAARLASERAARLSVGGSMLGALLVGTGRGPQRTRLGVAPAQSAALIALGSGAMSARAAARAPQPPVVPRGDWHAMTAVDAFDRLRAARVPQGPPAPPSRPTPRERARAALAAAARHPLIEAAVIAPARSAGELAGSVRHELQDPLTPVLALGAMASAVVGSSVDAVLVASVMAGNAVISGAQRMSAERSLGRLLLGEEISAAMVRWPGDGAVGGSGDGAGGRRGVTGEGFSGLDSAPLERTRAAELRTGDVIALREGDVTPADARLLVADGVEVDESPLTGESLPVAKSTDPTPGAPLTERTCMVYEGSTILAGHGFAIVTATGGATEAGRAAHAAGRGAPPTGIQARLAELTRIAVPASGLGGLAVAGLGLLRGVGLRQAIASGVAVAVAAVPEGLPLVATVAQLAAARRLTGTGVLVRSSRALEALGRVDVLCFDKTGTLTQGRLSVAKLATPDGVAAPGGADARRLLLIAARACPPTGGKGARALAHATDRAVVESARSQAGADPSWQLAEELPFEATRGYSASLGRSAGRTRLAVKGAPEVVLPRCAAVATGRARERRTAPMTPARQRTAEAVITDLAAQGLRVLAVAEADLPGPPSVYRLARSANGNGNGNGAGLAAGDGAGPAGIQARPESNGAQDIVSGLTLLGFLAIADTVRPSARSAVRQLANAGVRVAMITGDHPATAEAVARTLGVPHADRLLTGTELSNLPEAARAERIGAATVFARVSPEQKVRIVQSLQDAGHVVAMAGDGVNDSAAIRLADVGIGVTTRGSTSARSAADLILTDSDPARILEALVEGRALWARVRDAVSILVGGNAGEIAFTLLGTAVTGRAPLSTRQLLLVNMLTDMLPALAVALSSGRPDRDGESPLITAGPVGAFLAPELARSLAIRGGATALGASVAWQVGRLTGRRQRASTMGLATLVLTQLGQTLLTSGRSPLTVVTSAVSAGALAAIVEIPGVSQFFGCTPLGPVAWTVVTGSAAGATAAAAIAPRFVPVSPRLAHDGGGQGHAERPGRTGEHHGRVRPPGRTPAHRGSAASLPPPSRRRHAHPAPPVDPGDRRVPRHVPAGVSRHRSIGPGIVVGRFGGWWAYLAGPVVGAGAAVAIMGLVRGLPSKKEREAAEGTLLPM